MFGFNYVIQNDIRGLLREFPDRTGVGTEETTGCGTRGKYATVPERGWMLSLNRSGVQVVVTDAQNLEGVYQDIRLLGAHFLGGGPVEPKHKGGDRELGNDLFKKLPHGDLGIKDLIIRPDDPYIHIAHGDKVFHNAAA